MKRSLNLMSQKAQRAEAVRTQLRLWLKVLALVALATAVDYASIWWTQRRVSQERDAAERQYEPVAKLTVENRDLKRRISKLKEADSEAIRLVQPRPLSGLLGLVSQAVASTSGTVYLEQLHVERQDPDGNTLVREHLTMSVGGLGVDDAAAALLADHLRETGAFQQVKLVSTESLSLDGKPLRRFRLECTF